MKVFLATTFRDFCGTDNDRIQYLFLDSLKAQSFQDFKVVVTTFGEKNVEKVLSETIGADKCAIRQAEIPVCYRFSLTDVILHAIEVSEKCTEPSIIVWCTCDISLQSDFFQTIVDCFEKDFAGIVHPNLVYSSVESFRKGRGKVERLDSGIDLLFFDAAVLIRAKEDITRYRFFDWGVFEYFLVAIAAKHARQRLNLFPLQKIKKIVNDRHQTKESDDYFRRCVEINEPVLNKYVVDCGLASSSEFVKCYNGHRLFSVKKRSLMYLKALLAYVLLWSVLHGLLRVLSNLRKYVHKFFMN